MLILNMFSFPATISTAGENKGEQVPMGMVLRVESALAWFLRAAAGYLVALACGWGAVVGGFALFREIDGEFAVLGLVLLIYVGVPSLVLLLLSAPMREGEYHRTVLAFVLCGPAMFSGLLLGGWWLIGLILFQVGFVGFLLPSPRLRLVSRRGRLHR
ncbi:hypothetical protein ACIG5E_37555 [Kitasatospora sp. NPDC053057]|uniref:hypothetical protein n=1 Tax=Kitasatospora sp. NPDC053057 TaxID=3364062 RepID=UPI0037C6041A